MLFLKFLFLIHNVEVFENLMYIRPSGIRPIGDKPFCKSENRCKKKNPKNDYASAHLSKNLKCIEKKVFGVIIMKIPHNKRDRYVNSL